MEKDIRIGTLVNKGMDSASYIQQILPHGFESFSLTFWKTCEDIDFKKLADEVKAVLARSSEEVQHEVVTDSNTAKVHGDRGRLLGGGRTEVIDTFADSRHRRFSRERLDVGNGADESGLADGKASRNDDLYWDWIGVHSSLQRLEAVKDALK